MSVNLAGLVGLYAGLALVAFFVGAVNPAAIFARVLGKDLTAGSGNPGATNAGRVLGVRWGIIVAALDVLKGFVPAYVLARGVGLSAAYLVGIAAVLGHIFSPFLKGKGGKGVATALGAVLAAHPVFGLGMLVVFGVVVAATHWVAAGSMAAASALILAGVATATGVTVPGISPGTPWTAAWAITLGLIVLVRHRGNLRRAPRPGRHPA